MSSEYDNDTAVELTAAHRRVGGADTDSSEFTEPSIVPTERTHTIVRTDVDDDVHGGIFCSSVGPARLDDYKLKTTLAELPPNIYSAIIVSSSIEFGDSDAVNRILDMEIFLLSMANVLVQFIAVYFTYTLYDEALREHNNHSCGEFKTDRNLRWMAVGLWTFSLMNDVYETYSMQLWISYALGDFSASRARVFLENFADPCCCGLKPSYWFVPPQMREAQLVDKDGNPVASGNMVEIYKSLRGASCCQQLFIKVVVLGVKYFVALVLAVIGTGWLVQSETNEDLLLNCIALEFILQLSGNVYTFFLSSELKRFVEEDAPKFEITYEEGPTKCHRSTGILKKAFILGGFGLACNQVFCHDNANTRLNWF